MILDTVFRILAFLNWRLLYATTTCKAPVCCQWVFLQTVMLSHTFVVRTNSLRFRYNTLNTWHRHTGSVSNICRCGPPANCRQSITTKEQAKSWLSAAGASTMLCKAEDRTCTDRNRHDYVCSCNTAGGLIVRLFSVDSGKACVCSWQSYSRLGRLGVNDCKRRWHSDTTVHSCLHAPVLHPVTKNSSVQHILLLSMQITSELQSTGWATPCCLHN